MFILRKIFKDGEANMDLGSNYTLITEQDNTEEFNKIQQLTDGSEVNKLVYAYVVNQDGGKIPLSKNHRNYIMTENGRTFCNVTNH
jgi:hypothetical protein